jgi:hypothetical protein
VVCFGRRDWVRNLTNYRVAGWVGVSYNSVWGLIVSIRIRVHSTVIPGGIGGRTRVWIGKGRCVVCLPLAIHADCSLLWHPNIMS